MGSSEAFAFGGVSQPGDEDYPLKTAEGAAGSIAEIRKRCNKAALYEDPDFPATQASVDGFGPNSLGQYIWLRPHEICARVKVNVGPPKFAVCQAGDASFCSFSDVRQYGVGNCWLISAIASLTTNPEQLRTVVPEDNFEGFEDESYCGAFHFRIFHMASGRYTDIVVDDRLPYDVAENEPGFSRVLNIGPNYAEPHSEFWPGLLEKAFAKYRGSYMGLKAGSGAVGMMYLTGGFAGVMFPQQHRAPEKYEKLAKRVRGYLEKKQFMVICNDSDFRSKEEKAAEPKGFKNLGLVDRHGYSVVGYAEVKDKADPDKTHFLLHVRNPMADYGDTEWKGPLSDKDDEGWAKLAEDLRPRNGAGSTDVKEGLFWIDFREVFRLFYQLDYCLTGLGDGQKFCSIRSEWPAELQDAKIIPNDAKFFHRCPAFSFEVKRELLDSVEIPPEYEGKCALYLRVVAGEAGVPLDPIPKFWYFIHSIEDGDDISDRESFYKKRKWVKSSDGPNPSEVMNRTDLYLKPGRYLITVVLKTDDKPPVIPKAYVGKVIPFAVSLYTENETRLEKIN